LPAGIGGATANRAGENVPGDSGRAARRAGAPYEDWEYGRHQPGRLALKYVLEKTGPAFIRRTIKKMESADGWIFSTNFSKASSSGIARCFQTRAIHLRAPFY
jgi:hypothetical protein